MPIQVPLLNSGNIPLQQTGISVPRTAQLTAGDTGIGKALQNIGGMMTELANQAAQANDVAELTNASMAMQQAQMDFATFQQETPDETQWLPKWKEIENGLQNRFSQAKLTPSARARLQQQFSNWSTSGTIETQALAFKQTGRRAEMAVQNAVEFGKRTGDWKPAQAAKQAYNVLPLPEEYKQQANLAIDGAMQEAEQKRQNDDLMLIASPGPNSDPNRAEELAWQLADEGKITKMQALNIAEQAKQTRAVNRRDAIMFYKQKMETGKPVTADEMMADYRLTDMDRESLAMMQDGTRNDPAEFEKALTTVMDFDRSRFADDKQAVTALANLEANLEARFDGAYLSTLKKELDKRSTGISPEEAANDIGPALTMLEEEIERGGLGPVEKPVLKDGKPVMRDPKEMGFVETDGWFSKRKTVKENAGEPVPLMEPDKIAREAAAAVQREIRKTLESEVKAGKLKGQGAISARAIELFKAKGGKIAPVEEPASGLLPGIEQPRVDLNQILLRNGY